MSPYRSEKQRAFMHARHPVIAKRWDREYGPRVVAKPKVKVRRKKRVNGGR